MQPHFPQKNGDQSMGRSCRGLTIKIHPLIHALRMLAYFSLTSRQVSQMGELLPLLCELKPISLAADKTYDTNAILQHLKSLGIQALIPSKNRLGLIDN